MFVCVKIIIVLLLLFVFVCVNNCVVVVFVRCWVMFLVPVAGTKPFQAKG